MRRPALRAGLSHVAALMAVALLALAGVRSTVMQAAEASPSAATCMQGMAMGAAGKAAPADHKAPKTCDFCVAASVAPLASTPPVLLAPTSVAWRASVTPPGLGARGPPAFRPRARAPPPLLTA